MGARIRSLAARVRDLPPGRQDALLALAFFVGKIRTLSHYDGDTSLKVFFEGNKQPILGPKQFRQSVRAAPQLVQHLFR